MHTTGGVDLQGVMQVLGSLGPWLGGFVGGTLFGSVVMALLNFKLDTSKALRARRLALIDKARADLFKYPDNSANWHAFDFLAYMQTTDAWTAFCPHLSPMFLSKLQNMKYRGDIDYFDFDYLKELRTEIGRIEKQWKLI